MDSFPSNFKVLLVEALIALLSFETAICTFFISTGLSLNSFENFILNSSPPIETATTCLNVLRVKPGSGGTFLGSTNCGAVLQVPTHFFAAESFFKPWAEEHELTSVIKRIRMQIFIQFLKNSYFRILSLFLMIYYFLF